MQLLSKFFKVIRSTFGRGQGDIGQMRGSRVIGC